MKNYTKPVLHKTIKIRNDSFDKLKLATALSGKSIVDLMDDLISRELNHQKRVKNVTIGDEK